MKTKEIGNYIRQIKDYQAAYFDMQAPISGLEFQSTERRLQLQRSLLMSRANTI